MSFSKKFCQKTPFKNTTGGEYDSEMHKVASVPDKHALDLTGKYDKDYDELTDAVGYVDPDVTITTSTPKQPPLGGLKAVIITDFIQFTLAMVGSVWAMFYILGLPEIGGLHNLITHSNVIDKISLIPDMSDPDVWVPVLLVPLAVQWWASYYPGAEPGGGGYIAQRMFSAKDESNALGATLLFNIAHYAIRPWPWMLIALSSLIIYPELSDIQRAFPGLPADKLGHDIAYPAMLTLLPQGLLGLVSASLIAAFMSTMSTQLNLGASYLVNDLYHRFIKPNASEKELKILVACGPFT